VIIWAKGSDGFVSRTVLPAGQELDVELQPRAYTAELDGGKIHLGADEIEIMERVLP
jgi:hypothetical protein